MVFGSSECQTDCRLTYTGCVEQARLNAGNIQEEQEAVAACENRLEKCIDICHDQGPDQPESLPVTEEKQ